MDSPRRLLLVATIPASVTAFLLPLARHFRSIGWTVDVLAEGASQSPACVESFERCWDATWSRNPWDPKAIVKSLQGVRRLVEREAYDLVHVHTPVAGFLTRAALRGRNTRGRPRVIYTAHGFHFFQGGPVLRNAVFLTLERLAGRWTDYLVVMNQEDAAAARDYGILPHDRVRCMPGIGVDLAAYSRAAVQPGEVSLLRQSLGLSPDASVILVVAELIPRKRHRDVLAAMSRMTCRDAHLVIAGPGPLTESLQQEARRLSLDARVHFLGLRSDIPTLLGAADVLVLVSEHEGLPRSIMEAMCMGVPVIGSRSRGITDLLDGEGGVLVEKGDVHALARAMDRLLTDRHAAQRLARNAQERVVRYDVEGILRRHEQLYADALAAVDSSGARHRSSSRVQRDVA
jgi:glycosyltransferase involved in cell wall biosynthesis